MQGRGGGGCLLRFVRDRTRFPAFGELPTASLEKGALLGHGRLARQRQGLDVGVLGWAMLQPSEKQPPRQHVGTVKLCGCSYTWISSSPCCKCVSPSLRCPSSPYRLPSRLHCENTAYHTYNVRNPRSPTVYAIDIQNAQGALGRRRDPATARHIRSPHFVNAVGRCLCSA